LVRRRAAGPAPAKAASVRSFGLLAIAVDPARQGSGVGKALLVATEAAARDAKFDAMHLTVDSENAQAIRFYEGLGWVAPGRAAGRHLRMEKVLE
jgi:ribosomal protein S18 acetylase RimI-like enzyme